MVGCGDGSTTGKAVGSDAQVVTTTTLAPGQTYSGDLTTTDGYRYKVTVLVDRGSRTGSSECPAAAVPGRIFLPVTLTVSNQAADRPAPWPPLRIELTAAPGAKPAPVLVRDPAGTCTSAPRVAEIAAGGSVVFKGSTPAIDQAAGPGTAGQIQVSVSENRFSLAGPVP